MKALTNLIGSQRSLTSLVKEYKYKNSFISNWDYLPAILTNIFSVIFSLSIVIELRKCIDNIFVLSILSIFVIFFLIMNEIIKVKEIRKVYRGFKNSIISFVVTFLISITLASIGMYFFTNKSMDVKDNSNINLSIAINEIKLKFEDKINNVNNNVFENSETYNSLNKELYYWKHVSAATLIERNDIRLRIDKLQNDIQKERINFNNNKDSQVKKLIELQNNEISVTESKYNKVMNTTKKNDFITYIFLSLIFVTEFATIVLNKHIVEKQLSLDEFVNGDLAKMYTVSSNILTTLYMTSRNNETNIEKAKYSYSNKDNVLSWEDITRLYNILIDLGILDNGEIREIDLPNGNVKKLLYNKFLVSESEAHQIFDNYFEKYFKIA